MHPIITQAVKPGFKFWLSFFFLFPRSVANRPLVFNAHASPLHAYSTWNLQKLPSCEVSKDSFISRAMKSFPNERTVRSRPTLKDVKRFRNGSSPSITRDQFTSEHFQLIYQESEESSYSKRD